MESGARRGLPVAPLLVIGLPTLLLLAMSLPVFERSPASARTWPTEFAQLSETAAVDRIRQLSQNPDDSLTPLVPLLGDVRPTVAEAARQALSERLNQWHMLTESESTRRVANLARALAQSTPRLNTPGRRCAAELAVRLVCWPVDRHHARWSEILDDCENVLAAAPSRTRPKPSRAALTSLPAEVLRWPSLPVREVAGPQPVATQPVASPAHSGPVISPSPVAPTTTPRAMDGNGWRAQRSGSTKEQASPREQTSGASNRTPETPRPGSLDLRR